MLYRLTATINPEKLDEVIEALLDVGIREFTATEVRGFSRRAEPRTYRGVAHGALTARVAVDILVPGERAVMVAELLAANARTDSAADGTVCLAALSQVIDVRTGQFVGER